MNSTSGKSGRRAPQWRFTSVALLASLVSGCGGAAPGGNGGGGGGGGSAPPPALTSISPYNVPLGGNNWVVAGVPGFTLLLNGSGFTSSSVVTWNGSPLPTQFGDPTSLNATISSDLAVTPGTATITVTDSGTASNSLPFGIASPAAATAGVVQLITVAPDGSPANDDSAIAPSISTTGRYIAFQSAATNLASGPSSGHGEIYERDTCIGAAAGCVPKTIRITVTLDGSPVNAISKDSTVSADGRYVAFDSSATNLVANTSVCAAPNQCVFLRDTCVGATVSCQPNTIVIPSGGGLPEITPDGRYIALAGGLPNGPPLPAGGITLRDTCNGAPAGCAPNTILISQSTAGEAGDANSNSETVNQTGRFVAFGSWANNFAPQPADDTWPGVYLRDDCIGAASSCTPTTVRVDLAPDGSVPNGASGEAGRPAVSSDGRFVAYDSAAMNLVSLTLGACPTSGTPPQSCGYIFLRDTCNGIASGCTPATSLVSLDNDGTIPNSGNADESISADGRFVAFDSLANSLVPGQTLPINASKDVFVRDTCFGAPAGCKPSTVRVSITNSPGFATQANDFSIYPFPRISGDGHYVVFLSTATNLVPGVTLNGHQMVLLAKTGF